MHEIVMSEIIRQEYSQPKTSASKNIQPGTEKTRFLCTQKKSVMVFMTSKSMGKDNDVLETVNICDWLMVVYGNNHPV